MATKTSTSQKSPPNGSNPSKIKANIDMKKKSCRFWDPDFRLQLDLGWILKNISHVAW